MANDNSTDGQLERRQFLKRSLGVIGAASLPLPISQALAASDAGANRAPNVPEWSLAQGEPILSPPYGRPSRFEDGVVRTPTDLTPTKTSSWSFTPLQDLNGTITPNGLGREATDKEIAGWNIDAPPAVTDCPKAPAA